MEDLYIVDTPENIEFGYDIAGIGSRMLAAIVDTCVILFAQAIVLFVGALATQSAGFSSSVLTALGTLIGFLILWGYYIAFELLWNGQSIGKRMFGLRVVRAGGRPITFTASAIRNLVRLIDFLPVFYGIGVVAMFVDRNTRRLGDLAAGVMVVRERSAVTLDSLMKVATTPVAVADDGLEMLGIGALREADYQLVREFIDQRESLSRDARARLAGQLVRGIELRLQRGADGTPEQYLERVVRSYRQKSDTDNR